MIRNSYFILALMLASVAPAIAQTADAPVLPGGAKSLHEEHGDWSVSCRIEDSRKLCVMSQTLAKADTGEPLVSVELATPAVDRAEGMLLLPFGLRLADGAKLTVDTKPVGGIRPFLTCITSGCLVPVELDAGQVSALRSGSVLLISARSATGETVDLKVSLAGFAHAANRSVELGL